MATSQNISKIVRARSGEASGAFEVRKPQIKKQVNLAFRQLFQDASTEKVVVSLCLSKLLGGILFDMAFIQIS